MSLNDDSLDEEFPLGDGTAETDAEVRCPYCGEINEIALDPGSGSDQEYVEDCQVCCRPWNVTVHHSNTQSRDNNALDKLAREQQDGTWVEDQHHVPRILNGITITWVTTHTIRHTRLTAQSGTFCSRPWDETRRKEQIIKFGTDNRVRNT